MKKNFLSGAFFSVGLNLLVKTVWILGIELAVQRAVGTQSYGDYFSLFNFSLLFLILLDLGITNYNTRNIAQNNHLLEKNFTRLLAYKLTLGLVYLLVLFAVALITGYEKKRLTLLIYLAGVQVFSSLTLYFRSNIAALHHFKTDGVLSIIDRVLLIIICSLVLWSAWFDLEFNILLFAQIQFATAALTAMIALLVNLRFTRLVFPKKNPVMLMLIFRQSLPFALLFLTMSFYTRIDAVLLDQLIRDGKTQAGIYAAAFRLFDAYSQIIIIFTGILLPVFARQLKLKDDVTPVLKTSLSVLLFSAIAVAISGYWFSGPLSSLLYKQNVMETGIVLSVLLWALIPFVISMVMGVLLTAGGSMKALNIVAVMCLVLNLLLNLCLIPQIGAKGAAITAIAVHSLSALLLSYIAYKRLNTFTGYSIIIRLGIFLITGMACTFFIATYLPNLTGLALSATTLAVLGWVTGILPVNDMKFILLQRSKIQDEKERK